MFGIKHNECVGFESRWKVTKVVTASSTQTTDFSSNEKGTNTAERACIEVQTDDRAQLETTEADMERLAAWLSKIYPKVEKAMDECSTSQAFRGYRMQGDLQDANCKLLQNMSIVNVLDGGSGDKMTRISNITWNQTGKSIAISCNSEHDSWCHHNGCVVIFTLNRDGKIPDLPRKRLTTESCITSLKFHPTHPAIIAAGTFTGTVRVWNIQNEEEEDSISKENVHSEAITQISWVRDVDLTRDVLLATSSTDGYLKLWNFKSSPLGLNHKVSYKIKIPLFGAVKSDSEKIIQGIVAFDFSPHSPELFVVGLEGGCIAHCSTLGAFELKGSSGENKVFDPLSKYYEPHDGEITCISFSPTRSEMFLTCGTDAEVRIYLIGQEDPAQVIFIRDTLLDIAFVPYEEKLIAGCGLKGMLEIFNVVKGKALSDITTEDVRKSTLTKLAINGNKTNIVALGNSNGELQLWSVPWILFSMK
ncbi:unnamed protein product [Callosobruchus maculatus]|uniref:Dynein axonemal intermediate chain 4 n=1 Tax=Callosobruchus maculatus TaxID=64391 RepID=A0A653BVB7_CALMS|nr:unnamed protein product [Callosobruchus maculatus]